MVSWNFRIILHDDDPDPTQHWLGLHEVYYHEDDTVAGWTAEPHTFLTDAELGVDDLIGELELALETLKKPRWNVVLSLRDLRAQPLRKIAPFC